MAPRKDIQDLVLRVQTEGTGRATRELNKLHDLVGDHVDDIKDVGLSYDGLMGEIDGAIDAYESLNKQTSKLVDTYSGKMGEFHNALDLLHKVKNEAAKGLASKKQVKQVEKMVETRVEGLQEAQDLMEDTFKAEKEAIGDLAKDRTGVLKEVGGAFGKGMKDTFQAFMNKDAPGLVQAAGGGLKGTGSAVAKAGKGKDAAKMAEVVGKLGKFAALLGTITVGLAGIVKLLIDAEAQTKEMNQALMDGASFVDLMNSRFDQLTTQVTEATDTLAQIRSMATDPFENYLLGMKPEDHMKILSNLNQQGVLLRNLAENVGNIEGGWGGITRNVKTLSTVMGVSIEETADMLGKLRTTTQDSLDTVIDGMVDVAAYASSAEMSTKDFWGAVNQASGGLALYNFKLQETASLLSQTSEYMDPESAKQFTEAMATGFAEMGLGELAAVKTMAGPRAIEDALRVEFQNLTSQMGDEQQRGVETALKSLGFAGGADDLASTLMGMSEREQRSFITQLRQMGMDKLAQKMTKTTMLLDDMRGSDLEQLDAMRMLGSESQMAIRLKQLQRLSEREGASIQDLNSAHADVVNMTSDQLRQAQMLNKQLTGDFESLEEAAGNPEVDFAERAKALGFNVSLEEFEKLSEPLDLLGRRAEGVESERKTMREIAQEQVKQTQSVTAAIERGVEYLLNLIYEQIVKIKNLILQFDPFTSETRKREIEADQLVMGAMSRRRELQRDLKEASPEERQRIEKEIAKQERKIRLGQQEGLLRTTSDNKYDVVEHRGRKIQGEELIDMMAERGVTDPKELKSMLEQERRVGETALQGAVGHTDYTKIKGLHVSQKGESIKDLMGRRSKAREFMLGVGQSELGEELRKQIEAGDVTQEELKQIQQKLVRRMTDKAHGIQIADDSAKSIAQALVMEQRKQALARDLRKTGVENAMSMAAQMFSNPGEREKWDPKAQAIMKRHISIPPTEDASIITGGVPLLDFKPGDIVIDRDMLAKARKGKAGAMLPEVADAFGGGGGLTQHNVFHINGGNTQQIRRTILKTFEEYERKKLN